MNQKRPIKGEKRRVCVQRDLYKGHTSIKRDIHESKETYQRRKETCMCPKRPIKEIQRTYINQKRPIKGKRDLSIETY